MRLALALTLALILPSVASAQDNIPPQERYDRALRIMKRGNYTKAMEELQYIRNYHRDDPVSELAELAVADMQFKRGEYAQARLAYEDFARLHPRHVKLDYVVFRIGESVYKRAAKWAGRDQAPTQRALRSWNNFEKRFPESIYLSEVEALRSTAIDRLAAKEMWIAHFYANRGAWGAAGKRAEYLVREYPQTRHAPRGLFLLGTSFHQVGEIEQAKQIRAVLVERFPESRFVARLDRALAKAPGSPAEEEVFPKPYRALGATGMGGPPQ